MRIGFWWFNLKWDTRHKYERIRYLIKRNFISKKIPKDEFDPSLNMNLRDMLAMTEEEREIYTWDLIKRRDAAHNADNERCGDP